MFGFRQLSAVSLLLLLAGLAPGQSYLQDIARHSARSDIRTGGEIVTSELVANQNDLRLTVNVPSFEMTLWQGENEIKKFYVGVGLKDYPIFVGLRNIDTIIWNPAWIPPSSNWVAPALRGKVIGPADPRNPLGKIKIPLGYGYLIHQAKSSRDLGNLVSHGCLRVMRNDLYELNDRILKAQGLNLGKDVARAKRSRRTFVIELDIGVDLEITYDTMVVENGVLHIYPDVYELKHEKTLHLREELALNGVNESSISDESLEAMIAKAHKKSQYLIALDDIKTGNYSNGQVLPVVPRAAKR